MPSWSEEAWSEEARRRAPALAAAAHNVARLPATALTADLATDGGQSYPAAGGRPLGDAVRDAFGPSSWLGTGSGRGAEAVVAALAGPGRQVLANEVYVSGAWWIERLGGAVAPLPELRRRASGRGDGDRYRSGPLDDVAYVQITAPPAQLGPDAGHPVTLGELQGVRAWIDRNLPHAPLVVDGSRLWENAVAGDAGVREVARLADVVLLSAGKDLGCGTGGLIVGRSGWWWPALERAAAVLEGPGAGLGPAELAAMADGLDQVAGPGGAVRRREELDRLARVLRADGLAVSSLGCGSVFLDADVWLPRVPADQLPAQTLLNLLYLRTGIRGLGTSTDEVGSRPIVRLAVRGSADLLARELPGVAAHGRELRSGMRSLPRDRAAPYLRPVVPVDPDAWPETGPASPAPRPGWLVGRCRPGRGPQRALADAWGRVLPGAELRGADVTLHRLHALLGGVTGATRRPVVDAYSLESQPAVTSSRSAAAGPGPGVEPADLAVGRLASADGWRSAAAASPWVDAWWASTEDGGWVAVRVASPLADALDQGALFTLGSWLRPEPA